MSENKTSTPQNWADIDEKVRQAMIDQANDRLFWNSATARLGVFTKIAQMFLVVGGLFAVMKSGAIDFITGVK